VKHAAIVRFSTSLTISAVFLGWHLMKIPLVKKVQFLGVIKKYLAEHNSCIISLKMDKF